MTTHSGPPAIVVVQFGDEYREAVPVRCEECGLVAPPPHCLCPVADFYWHDGAEYGVLEDPRLTEEQKADRLPRCPGGNWGNPFESVERVEGRWVVCLRANGFVRRQDVEKAFPGCRVVWLDYQGPLSGGAIIATNLG